MKKLRYTYEKNIIIKVHLRLLVRTRCRQKNLVDYIEH